VSNDRNADAVEFDDMIALALARSAADAQVGPRPEVRERLLASLAERPVPAGFSFHLASDPGWVPHSVPGIRMKVLAKNRRGGYATLLLDVSPGVRFPPHHHGGAEECYVISGSLYTCGRRMDAGDFLHADADTDHGELWTEHGCRVLLVVPDEDDLPDAL
jgi:quercetin dioxygenase-like cupin family protein